MQSTVTVVLAATLALVACGPDVKKEDTGTVVGAIAGGVIGNQFGKGGGRVAATLAGAVVGGIVGNEIGRSLDVRDRELARQAEFDAWERGPPGRPVRWRNPDNGRYGEVVAEDYYERGGSRCRDFVHRVYIDGRPQAMRGTACRNPDGTWTQVG
jgi:surface antigen